MTNALGDTLPEEQLSSHSKVLCMFDEAEANDGPLTRSQLILKAPEILLRSDVIQDQTEP